MIAVLSDIHDNLANLKTALDFSKSKNVSALFVLGDITNSDTLKYLAKNFPGQIYLVAGNMEVCDLEMESKKYKNIIYLGRKGGVIEIAGKFVGLCHEPTLANNLIKQGAQIIFYGHTHKPWSSYAPYSPKTLMEQTEASEDKEETRPLPNPPLNKGRASVSSPLNSLSSSPLLRGRSGGGRCGEVEGGYTIKLVNPGNISNTLYAASFALWNEATDELELKIL